MATGPRRLADVAMAETIAKYVGQGMEEITAIAKQRKAEILDELGAAKNSLSAAEAEAGRLRSELNGRPTAGQLDAAERRVQEAQDRVDTLTAKVAELESELEIRPSSPDQVLDLIREQLDPVFRELQEVVRA